MKKNLLTILLAGLLLLTATACNKDPQDPADTNDTASEETTGSYIVVQTGTGEADTKPVEPDTDAETEAPDPSEENPTFTDSSAEIIIVSNAAAIRSATQLKEDNIVAWPSEGKTYTVTGESTNWYRIDYEGATCYIAKTVAGNTDVLATFTAIEGGKQIEITADYLNVRSYPSADFSAEISVRASLKKGTIVTCVAENDSWCRIKFEVKATDGTVTEVKEYYVSKKYVKDVNAAEETTAAASDAQ